MEYMNLCYLYSLQLCALYRCGLAGGNAKHRWCDMVWYGMIVCEYGDVPPLQEQERGKRKAAPVTNLPRPYL